MGAPRTKPTPANLTLAPVDQLKREIQAVLDDELRQQPSGTSGRFDGHSYAATEAYFHLAGGKDSGLQPMQRKHRGKSHWWLLDPDGSVIDLTLAPQEPSYFPYHRGAKRPFRYTPAGISRRAQTVVDRVKAARN